MTENNWKEKILNGTPIGWVKAFGDLLCEELSEAIGRLDQEGLDEFEKFHNLDVKEKYGVLRIYYGGNGSVEIADIIHKFEELSCYICPFCGKPDVPLLRIGWCIPCCSDCYYEHKIGVKPYTEMVYSGPDNMPTELTFMRSVDGTPVGEIIDISETVKKIRERWSKEGEDM